MNEQELKEMLDAMEQDVNKGKRFWTPEEGKNVIRILPPLKKKEEVLFYQGHKTHWIDGQPYECLDQTIKDKNGNVHTAEHCPICAMSKKLYKISDEDSEERRMAADLNAKSRYIFRIVVRGKDDETEPELYETGPAIFKKIYNIIKDGEYGNIVDPIKGRDFIIDRLGTGRRTNYDASLPSPKETPIFESKEKLKKVLQNAEKLEYFENIELYSADEMKNVLNEYLNPTVEEKSSSKPNNTEARVSTAPASSDDFDDEPDESSEDDQIQDILNEFV